MMLDFEVLQLLDFALNSYLFLFDIYHMHVLYKKNAYLKYFTTVTIVNVKLIIKIIALFAIMRHRYDFSMKLVQFSLPISSIVMNLPTYK